MLGAILHLDHVVRGNRVGWPLTPGVNAFTYSLAVYPPLGGSLHLTRTRRVGAGCWAGFFAASAGLLASLHVGPRAVEPPRDVVGPRANPAVGSLASASCSRSLGRSAPSLRRRARAHRVALIGSVYAAVLWHRTDG